MSRHDIDMAIAVARERLLEAHATQALELIERAHGQVAAARALRIYCRVNDVSGEEAAALERRVLAHLGKLLEQGRGDSRLQGEADAIAEEWDSPVSLLRRIRRRLGGRKNHELRRWVELHAGRTQVELLRVHVHGALRVIELQETKHSFAEAVELYTERMGVAPPLARAVYFLALDRLSQTESGGTGRRREPQVGSEETPPLRILTS